MSASIIALGWVPALVFVVPERFCRDCCWLMTWYIMLSETTFSGDVVGETLVSISWAFYGKMFAFCVQVDIFCVHVV